MKTLNILFISSEYPPNISGGIGNFIKVLGEYLVIEGHNVFVVGLYKNIPEEKDEMINGVKVIRMKSYGKHFVWILERLFFRKRIKQLIEEYEIDIIEDNDWDSMGGFLFNISVPIIFRLHGGRLSTIRNLKEIHLTKRLLVNSSVKMSYRVVSVSKNMADSFTRIYRYKSNKIKVLYNGVKYNQTPKRWKERKENIAMFVGTLNETKGIIQLIKAWEIVSLKIPDATLIVYGKDAKHNGGSMKKFIHDSFSLKNIVFKGHVSIDELYKAYSESSLFVLPSFFEAFSLAPLEAMANACPTIYTKMSSGIEVIDDGINGILVDPNDVNEIANAIIKVMNDEEFAEKLSINGYNRVKQDFSIKHTLQQNILFYKTCIDDYKQDNQ